jgi:hypothetical protein
MDWEALTLFAPFFVGLAILGFIGRYCRRSEHCASAWRKGYTCPHGRKYYHDTMGY